MRRGQKSYGDDDDVKSVCSQPRSSEQGAWPLPVKNALMRACTWVR